VQERADQEELRWHDPLGDLAWLMPSVIIGNFNTGSPRLLKVRHVGFSGGSWVY
jgi:hypothetical protein